ncbi:MAG TPA: 50S ribosomal protein L9 [Actinomycetota bacterium]|jgi:large subunit ribosomal protein L9|nr:50S ribosomal protein L9 [Actinomycetota bacterium]
MRIILQREVQKLGVPGDIVEVKDGYARNYLLPRGLAIPASRGAVKHAEQLREAHDSRAEKAKTEAETLAAELARTPLMVASKAGEDGKLFGSVTAQHLADELSRATGQQIDRKRIHLDEPIRSLGTHEVDVHLHPEVDAKVTVEVVAE